MGSADGNLIRIGDSEFETLTRYVKKHYGINLSEKRALIEGRLNGYLVSNGFDSYKSYLETLFGDKTGGEVSSMINYLTTNYSYFMREKEHFDYLTNNILPELKKTIKDRDLRIWSAGCSTGEEAYTLAMVLNDFFGPEGELWDKKVLATDISKKALDTAKKGVYEKEALNRLPSTWRLVNFEKQPDGNFRIKENIRNEVIYRRFNLMEESFPFKRKFHVIFCRNVMIYFDHDAKNRLVEQFYDATEPGGYLIVSHSEALNRSECKYRYVMPSIFRKEG